MNIEDTQPDIPSMPDLDPATRTENHVTEDERVDEAIDESFPASDPPSWNSGLEHHDSLP